VTVSWSGASRTLVGCNYEQGASAVGEVVGPYVVARIVRRCQRRSYLGDVDHNRVDRRHLCLVASGITPNCCLKASDTFDNLDCAHDAFKCVMPKLSPAVFNDIDVRKLPPAQQKQAQDLAERTKKLGKNADVKEVLALCDDLYTWVLACWKLAGVNPDFVKAHRTPYTVRPT
jgi:hypothetical protein